MWTVKLIAVVKAKSSVSRRITVAVQGVQLPVARKLAKKPQAQAAVEFTYLHGF